jgi:DNA-binding Xre family transcriptional regulator
MILDKKKIQILCASNGYNFKELIEKANISKGIYNSLKMKSEVHPSTAGKIAKALGANVSDILKGDD